MIKFDKNIGDVMSEEQKRIELLKEINTLENEIRKDNKKKLQKKFLIILLIIFIIKFFWGTIEIYNIFLYPESKSRLYDVSINNEKIATESLIHKRVPIIPYIIYYNSFYGSMNYITGDENIWYINSNQEELKLKINSYSCFYKNVQIKCDYENYNNDMKLNTDTKYIHLLVRKNDRPQKIIYDGVYTDDLTNFASEKGSYYIEIIAKYSYFIKTKISFNLKTI